jgi:hypothetical protein
VTALAMPAPAWSINASTSVPRAKAALSALRIWAEIKTGDSNQTSCFAWLAIVLAPVDLVDFFFFEDLERERFFLEALERERLELLTFV